MTPRGVGRPLLFPAGSMGVADLATQAAAFGATGALLLGSTRVATDTARSMLERGSSGTEAFWGSMAVGTANMLIYEYGVGGLMKLAGPVDPSTVEGMLSGAFKRAGVTATAGATSELSRILIDTAAMGNSSEFDLEVKLLRMEGMSAEEAWRQTFTDYVERVVDTGVRSGRYGLIAGLSEYGGEYFRQHPEAFNALVSGKTGWSGGMQGLTPGGAQGLLGLPGATLAPGGRMGGMPMLPGPAAVKDDWETAIEEAVAEQGVGDPEDVDISGENGTIIGRGIGGTNGQVVLPSLAIIKGKWDVRGGEDAGEKADIPKAKIDEILKAPKYSRPDPTTYLQKEFITKHTAQFKEGVTKISYQAPSGYAGPPGGTFVMPTSVADALIAEAGGDMSKLERLLGLNPGDLGMNPVRIDIANPTGLRMPSGNEKGANLKWIPGGYTNGGIPEMVIDSPGPGQYTVKLIK